MSEPVKLILFSAAVFLSAFAATFLIDLPVYLLVVFTLFFGGFTFLLNHLLRKAMHAEDKNKFTTTFLGMTGAKILGSSILLVVILSFTKSEKMNIGLCVLYFYLLYTIFEVASWKKKLKA